MNTRLKIVIMMTMTIALSCGFMHHLVGPEQLNFERLHIFLFNLCSGGTLLIYFTEEKRSLSWRGKLFFLLSILFALTAFLKIYVLTLFIPLLLAAIVESIRIKHFGNIFPVALFTAKETISRKFHQSSLLCLSLGLIISSPVILNDVFMKWVTIEKLKLDTFFLGFSFPLSLISMSVIFALMKEAKSKQLLTLKSFAFWTINLGVIIFFGFILAKWYLPQIAISITLFLAVALVLYLYYHEGIRLQQKTFLTSGILFLLFTSITGIIYIFLSFSSYYIPEISKPLLRLHSFTALYGWNLSGLAVISRHGDFPIRLHSQKVIILHWITVALLCPLGYFIPFFSVVAVVSYVWLLYTLMFNDGKLDRSLIDVEHEAFAEERKTGGLRGQSTKNL